MILILSGINLQVRDDISILSQETIQLRDDIYLI